MKLGIHLLPRYHGAAIGNDTTSEPKDTLPELPNGKFVLRPAVPP
jgi:hypothetical protein